jgi:hypothetical protein
MFRESLNNVGDAACRDTRVGESVTSVVVVFRPTAIQAPGRRDFVLLRDDDRPRSIPSRATARLTQRTLPLAFI